MVGRMKAVSEPAKEPMKELITPAGQCVCGCISRWKARSTSAQAEPDMGRMRSELLLMTKENLKGTSHPTV